MKLTPTQKGDANANVIKMKFIHVILLLTKQQGFIRFGFPLMICINGRRAGIETVIYPNCRCWNPHSTHLNSTQLNWVVFFLMYLLPKCFISTHYSGKAFRKRWVVVLVVNCTIKWLLHGSKHVQNTWSPLGNTLIFHFIFEIICSNELETIQHQISFV